MTAGNYAAPKGAELDKAAIERAVEAKFPGLRFFCRHVHRRSLCFDITGSAATLERHGFIVADMIAALPKSGVKYFGPGCAAVKWPVRAELSRLKSGQYRVRQVHHWCDDAAAAEALGRFGLPLSLLEYAEPSISPDEWRSRKASEISFYMARLVGDIVSHRESGHRLHLALGLEPDRADVEAFTLEARAARERLLTALARIRVTGPGEAPGETPDARRTGLRLVVDNTKGD